ncbi:MAG: Ig-like domain-containing protein [Planctomycetales bacterium]|nr:Ig-like domain-containing protein [bacterium]UNM07382.1 MAG: Ig-like domain-containing protein [Planctomycetales bacterium]
MLVMVAPASALFDLALIGNIFFPNHEQVEGTAILTHAYPEALPNDGRSESEIQVMLVNDGKPLAGETVEARVTDGGGFLASTTAVTDEAGLASFDYRSGMLPTSARISFHVAQRELSSEIEIPIAPVTYLNLQLVTPEEYQLYLDRQSSAANYYRLQMNAFPDQLAADGSSISTLSARLTHADGSPAPGVPLLPVIQAGEGQLIIEQKATDAQGNFSVDVMSGRQPGVLSVALIEPSTGLTESFNFTLVKSTGAHIELFYNNQFSAGLARKGAVVPADGVSELNLVAEVTDLYGLPLSGVEIRVEFLDEQNGQIQVIDPVTDASGQVQLSYYAGTFTGPVKIRAYVSSGLDKAGSLLGL